MELGITVQDQITGFRGVVIGHVQYLTGCNQALVQPGLADLSEQGHVTKRPDSEWFDVQRLQRVGNTKITLDNGSTPGADRAAPKR